ncbi:MAG TPA: S-layer homology domain-containing protein, partial [Acidimicrobiia bacterium]|nr:S-layer homology domain-containing protein [Acidimicrobiia bacterium]
NVFASDIEWLADSGITKGCNPPTNTLFCPDEPVTRGQMAAFLHRALPDLATGAATDFRDDNGLVFESDVEWLSATGVTRGCNPPTNDRFCPHDTVTRAQMAAFLHRALPDLVTDAGSVDFVDDNGSVFEADIEWLAATGVTRGCNPPTNDRFCPNAPVTRGAMAAFLHRALGS